MRGIRYGCPLGTFRAEPGGTSEVDCSPCPDGYDCETPGTADFSLYPCQPNRFCVAGRSHPCPAGRFHNHTLAMSESDCEACPPGFQCPGGGTDPVRHPVQAGDEG